MRLFRKSRKINIFLWVGMGLLVSCAVPERSITTKYPVAFETAIRLLTNTLLERVESKRELWDVSKKVIVLDPFIDRASGEVVQVSHQIEKIIFEETKKKFDRVRVIRITSQSFRDADYVLNGVIDFTDYEAPGSAEPEKYYQISASIVQIGSGEIIANVKTWVTDKDLDYTPDPIYRDSPTFVKDKRTESHISTARMPEGEQASPDYYSTLDTHALLVEAETFYTKEDYKKALQLFEKVADREDGKLMKTYAGLYEINYKLGNFPAAEAAFGKLLAASVQESNKLNVKFLFEVNSTDFINNVALRNQYSIWLLQMNKFFEENQYCFYIVGHSSRTGASKYNKKLSLARATKVQELMKQANFPEVVRRSKTQGKGFEENVVGSGTDDARDAIDRRVEFSLVDCKNF